LALYQLFPDLIEIALDVSADGRLPLPPYAQDSPSQIHNITIFLFSYDKGRNFTITNGTASANNASLGDIMLQEPGSTVKHVRWTWPDCLVGDGGQQGLGDTDRGVYNVRFSLSTDTKLVRLTETASRSPFGSRSASTARTTTPSSIFQSPSPTASPATVTDRRATH
jgi:hypothetical protein